MGPAIGLILARGGSKGVPGKNIRLLGGKPLITHTIEASLNSKLDRTIVSTDSEEIARIARQYGAEVPFMRPPELATDTATSLSAVQHAIEYLEKVEGYFPDIIAILQPTSPFRTHRVVDAGLKLLIESGVDSVVGVRRIYEEHPYFMLTVDDNGDWKEFIEVEGKPSRRQDVPPCYLINGSIDISRRSYFNGLDPTSFAINTKNFKGLETDRLVSVDINDEFDFKLAETYWRQTAG